MKHTSLLARAAAATATLGAAIAGAVVMHGPAQAALVETNYAYYGWAFGTNVHAQQVGLSSPTAFSYVGCTRLAGKVDKQMVAAVDAPSNVSSLGIGAVTSQTSTFLRSGNKGTESTNKIANVRIGPVDGPHLVIKGLETLATTYADKSGKFHTSNSFKLADITSATGTPVDDVLNQVGVTIGDLFKAIREQPGDNLVIPGVGRIAIGARVSAIRPLYAKSNAVALRVVLFGQDSAEGGGDDATVIIGRSHAKIYRKVPAAVMSGYGYAADAKVLGTLASVGQLAKMPLECRGTAGNILQNSVVGLNLGSPDAVDRAVATGRVYGIQYSNGTATAWTEGRVAALNLGNGDLVIKGVVGRANIHKSRTGKITKSKNGTKVASITAGGTEYDIPAPGEVLEIPGVATIRFGVVEHGTRSLKVTAIRVKLLSAAAEETGLATVNLGVAFVRMTRL